MKNAIEEAHSIIIEQLLANRVQARRRAKCFRALHQHIHLGAGVDAFDAFPHFLVLVMLAAEFATFIERRGAEVQHVELVSVDASRQALKRIDSVVVVAIEEHDEFTLCSGDAGVARSGQTGVLRQCQHRESSITGNGTFNSGKRAILRAVVHHDALEIVESLGFERFKAFADIAFDVIRRNNDGELQQGRP